MHQITLGSLNTLCCSAASCKTEAVSFALLNLTDSQSLFLLETFLVFSLTSSNPMGLPTLGVLFSPVSLCAQFGHGSTILYSSGLLLCSPTPQPPAFPQPFLWTLSFWLASLHPWHLREGLVNIRHSVTICWMNTNFLKEFEAILYKTEHYNIFNINTNISETN